MNIIQKIKEANLCGRGGAGFPTGKKWEMVRDAEGDKKYVIANGSEGEPGVFKDSYILEKNPEKIVKGVIIAMEAVGADEGYIYLREDLFHEYKKRLKLIIDDELRITNKKRQALSHEPRAVSKKIHVFREDGKYLNGEETTMLNSIEKKRSEPRFKPPFPTTCGLWKCPTLVNNVETFYRVAEIAEGKYENKRFYSLSGKVENPGVFELDVDLTIEEVLKKTGNWGEQASSCELRAVSDNEETPLRGQGGVKKPQEQQINSLNQKHKSQNIKVQLGEIEPATENHKEILRQAQDDNFNNSTDFFVQAGGGAHGNIYTKDECKDAVLKGAGALVVHTYDEDLVGIMKEWTKFFLLRNCGQCIPCREGFYRINQLLREKEINFELIKEILEVMEDASFCALGQFAPEGYFDFMRKILKV